MYIEILNHYVIHLKVIKYCMLIATQERKKEGTSVVVQWLRICLQMQGMRVRSLVVELRSHLLWDS